MNAGGAKQCRGRSSWLQSSVELRLPVLVGKPLRSGQQSLSHDFSPIFRKSEKNPHHHQTRCSLHNGPTKGQRHCGSSCKLPKNKAPEAVALLILPHPGTGQVSRRSVAGPSLACQRKLKFRTESLKGTRHCQVQFRNFHMRKVNFKEKMSFPRVTQVVPAP